MGSIFRLHTAYCPLQTLTPKEQSNIKNSLTKIDYLIVGQGLAGSLLSWFLLSENQESRVIDSPNPHAASQVAAGIMNPVTGRRFVKSWRIEELLPFAKSTYQALENYLDIKFLYHRNILRTIFSQKEENDWLLRTGEPAYQKYFLKDIEVGKFEGKIEAAHSFCELQKSAQVDVPFLVKSFRQHLLSKDLIYPEHFDYQSLKVEDTYISYKNIQAKKIIFCEGAFGNQNPWFSYLPFNESKGEVLIVKIPEVNFERMLKHKLFVVPLKDNHYWIGSFYKWDFENETPTLEGRTELESKLQQILKVPYEIIGHKAAIRPTVKDRRPFLGLHPNFQTIGIFNGLGTKGASLGPFFAKEMANFLLNKSTLDPEVDIGRFEKS